MGVISMLSSVQTVYQTVGNYRNLRENGQGRIHAAVGAYVNARIFANPWLMLGMMAPAITKKFLIERPQRNMHAIRRNMAAFAKGTVQDNDLMQQSRGALMQSAVASNSTQSLSGHSWAGMEASVMHGRYR